MTAPGLAYRRSVDAGVESLNVILDSLLLNCPSATVAGRTGAQARLLIGSLKANAETEIVNKTIGTSLRACYIAVYDTGMTFDQFDRVRVDITAYSPSDDFAVAVNLTGMVMNFAMQCQRLTTMTFDNRDDVATMLKRVGVIVEELKMEAADLLHSQTYQQVVQLAATVMQHLAVTEGKVPRVVYYNYKAGLPALTLAHRIYQDADRFNELIAENRIVHPAFFQLRVRALSR